LFITLVFLTFYRFILNLFFHVPLPCRQILQLKAFFLKSDKLFSKLPLHITKLIHFGLCLWYLVPISLHSLTWLSLSRFKVYNGHLPQSLALNFFVLIWLFGFCLLHQVISLFFFLGRCFGLVDCKSRFSLFLLAFHVKVLFFLDHCLMIFVKVYVVVFLKVYHWILSLWSTCLGFLCFMRWFFSFIFPWLLFCFALL